MKKLLKLLPKNCKSLVNLVFESLRVDFTRVQSAFDEFFVEMKENLKTVGFNEVYIFNETHNSTWETILKNLSLCQKLETIVIANANKITSATLSIISNLQNLKTLALGQPGVNTTELGTFFQQMKSEKLEYLQIGGSQFVTVETLENLSNRKLTNLREIWFAKCPNLQVRESTLKNLKNCPKLKKVGFEWSNLNGISTQFLREFNKQISVYFFHQDLWMDFEKKLILDYCNEEIIKMIEGLNLDFEIDFKPSVKLDDSIGTVLVG